MTSTPENDFPKTTPECSCHRCASRRHDALKRLGLSAMERLQLRPAQMVVCVVCGNKRCPQASDHRRDCTGSNAAGQPGSIYA